MASTVAPVGRAFHAFPSLARLIDRRDWSIEGATWQYLREVVGAEKT